MTPKLRVALLIAGLACTVGAVHWASSLTDVPEASAGAVVEGTPRQHAPPAPPATASANPGLDLQKLQRRRGQHPEGDPFGRRSFKPAPPKPAAAAPAATVAAVAPPPPPPPQAPPLPFVYMGRLSEDANTTIFLTSGERNLVVKPGDVIDNNYKLESVSDTAAVLTYLPLNQRQTLPIGTP
jgi:hypothetical protein